MNVQIPNYKTAMVRDIFAFCRFADLSYIDVKCLTPEYLATDDQNNVWIYETQKYVPNSVAFRKWVSHALSESFRMGKPEEPPVILVNYVPGRFGGTDELKGTFMQGA
jgi:hypothetical protein